MILMITAVLLRKVLCWNGGRAVAFKRPGVVVMPIIHALKRLRQGEHEL